MDIENVHLPGRVELNYVKTTNFTHWSSVWYKSWGGGDIYSFVSELSIHFSLFPASGA